MRHRVNRAPAFLLVALVALLIPVGAGAAMGSSAPAAELAEAKQVAVHDNYFSPRSIRVRRGRRVTWTWRGTQLHSVYFTRAPRGAKPRNCGSRTTGRCTRTFRKRGTYRYVCTFHGTMTGRVRVP